MIPSIFAVLRDPVVRNHPQLRAIRSASTASEWPITLRAYGATSSLAVTVNEVSGDDRTGDGSRARPFRSYERAASALGIGDVDVLRAARLETPLRNFEEVPVDVFMPPEPKNRHERRVAAAIARRR